ncbi:levanase/fructan beta-fructosidase [Evansella caseinilytica]|uniref:Levanase/fructan beta-fructosidase n=1 Tax=Evansella caseinilytica TaxID=1503961 RepID=A0A1H3UUD2_9BACI|nr:glycoside hydrolase family 32 protein [Evansella caseinilytica]SDZ65409.1 levanase/fructan beta-fructosidase [Evansella caseinilytica]
MKQSTDKARPYLHFAPKKNWMNDPNGMVYFNGEYHLFFQHNPYDSVWGPMHWGHAVSKDMINWEELDIALSPDDLGMIFSGSAVVDWKNTTGFFPEEPGLVAIFTHHSDRKEGAPAVQSQSLAYSHDNGRTWVKYEHNPVLIHNTKADFRDPKVFWHGELNNWIMVLAAGQAIMIYSSPNLKDWQLESEFGEGIGNHDAVWECPDLFPLPVENSTEKKWVFIVSIGDNPSLPMGSRTQYFVGDFNGKEFIAEHKDVRWLDYGMDNYAGVSFSDIPEEDGRRIYLGWMSNWRYANQVPTTGWRSQMTLPRELSLTTKNGDYLVKQRPVMELNQYFIKNKNTKPIHLNREEISYFINEPYVNATFRITNKDAAEYGLKIHYGERKEAVVFIQPPGKKAILDRSQSGITDFSETFSTKQTVQLEQAEDISMQIIIDASSIELFLNDGEYALTSLVFPNEICERISLFAKDGAMDVVENCISVPSTDFKKTEE